MQPLIVPNARCDAACAVAGQSASMQLSFALTTVHQWQIWYRACAAHACIEPSSGTPPQTQHRHIWSAEARVQLVVSQLLYLPSLRCKARQECGLRAAIAAMCNIRSGLWPAQRTKGGLQIIDGFLHVHDVCMYRCASVSRSVCTSVLRVQTYTKERHEPFRTSGKGQCGSRHCTVDTLQ